MGRDSAPCAPARITSPRTGDDDGLSFSDLCALANAIYDVAEAGTGLPDFLTKVFDALGIPVLSAERNGSDIVESVAVGQPVVSDLQIRVMATGFRNRTLVGVDSFFATLAEYGARVRGTNNLVNRASLADQLHLALFPTRTRLEPEDVLPALVVALGHERARREAQHSLDPVWDDIELDPLQFAILSFLLTDRISGAGQRRIDRDADRSGPVGIGTGVAFLRAYRATHRYRDTPDFLPRPMFVQWNYGTDGARVRDVLTKMAKRRVLAAITRKIGEIIEFPLGLGPSAEATFCASIILYSYKLALVKQVPTNGIIWHRQPERPDRPYKSDLTAQLVFDFQLDPRFDFLRKKAGCGEFPRAGLISGKTLEWHVDPALANHGRLEGGQQPTDGQGQIKVSYIALDERTPPALRKQVQSVDGWVEARATGLLPGKRSWEVVLRFLGGQNGALPSEDRRRLVVNYFVPSRDFRPGPGSGWQGVKCNGPTGEWHFVGTPNSFLQSDELKLKLGENLQGPFTEDKRLSDGLVSKATGLASFVQGEAPALRVETHSINGESPWNFSWHFDFDNKELVATDPLGRQEFDYENGNVFTINPYGQCASSARGDLCADHPTFSPRMPMQTWDLPLEEGAFCDEN